MQACAALEEARGPPFFEKQPSCTVALEACGASHHWAREITARGHQVKLVPPPFVKRFMLGRRKTDARDAKALAQPASAPICALCL